MIKIEDSIKQIRSNTRVALPSDDGYIFQLGVALYGFAYVANFMTEVCQYLDPANPTIRGDLQAKEAGKILDGFRQAAKKVKSTHPNAYSESQFAASLFENLNTRRSDIIHSYPITNSASEQTLWRTHSVKNKNFEVTIKFLDTFIADLEKTVDKLYAVRKIMGPNL